MNNENDFISKDPGFQSLVKKAKKDSMIRMVVISLIVSIFVVIGLYFVGKSIMISTINKEVQNDSLWNSIHGANIEEDGTSINYSFFSATTSTKFNKIIDGVPVPWVPSEKNYSLFGISKAVTNVGVSGSGNVNDERIPLYFNGQREIEFFHPGVDSKPFDDRSHFNKIDENKVAEVALSFDKGYSINEIQKIFNKNLAWCWVNTYNQDDIKGYNDFNKNSKGKDITFIGDSLIGFNYTHQHENNWGATIFINNLINLKNNSSYKLLANNIISNLTNNHKVKLVPKNLEIIGVVVTGTPNEIKRYINLPFIRANTLGVVIDKY